MKSGKKLGWYGTDYHVLESEKRTQESHHLSLFDDFWTSLWFYLVQLFTLLRNNSVSGIPKNTHITHAKSRKGLLVQEHFFFKFNWHQYRINIIILWFYLYLTEFNTQKLYELCKNFSDTPIYSNIFDRMPPQEQFIQTNINICQFKVV